MSSADGIIRRLLDRIPNWVGFGIIIVIGIIAIIVGATRPSAGFIAFGIAAIISSMLAWVTGSRSRPDVFNGSFGATVSNVAGWVWWVVFGMFVVVAIIAIATR
jgi:hypothetical protein